MTTINLGGLLNGAWKQSTGVLHFFVLACEHLSISPIQPTRIAGLVYGRNAYLRTKAAKRSAKSNKGSYNSGLRSNRSSMQNGQSNMGANLRDSIGAAPANPLLALPTNPNTAAASRQGSVDAGFPLSTIELQAKPTANADPKPEDLPSAEDGDDSISVTVQL